MFKTQFSLKWVFDLTKILEDILCFCSVHLFVTAARLGSFQSKTALKIAVYNVHGFNSSCSSPLLTSVEALWGKITLMSKTAEKPAVSFSSCCFHSRPSSVLTQQFSASWGTKTKKQDYQNSKCIFKKVFSRAILFKKPRIVSASLLALRSRKKKQNKELKLNNFSVILGHNFLEGEIHLI